MSREFDLVLSGITGFTGRLVAEYLREHAPAGLRIAVCGRSAEKLEKVTRELGVSWPHIVADAADLEALTAMARRCTVVISTVGPYARLGLPLVRACAEAGTHYTDLTGEVTFMRRSIDACDARAKETGAAIVHSCGFDSIPSDLGVLLLHDRFAANGQALAEAQLYVDSARGGVSGGTLASMLDLLDEAATSREVRALLADPHALAPGPRPRDRHVDRSHAELDARTQRWTAPFVMAQVNTRVVHRSNALLGHPYGEDFRYDECVVTGAGSLGLLRAHAVAVGLGAMMLAAATEPGRALMRRFVPKPGSGPDEQTRARGGFRITVRGRSRQGARAQVRIVGKSDPGYGETAKMLSEAALLLLERGPARTGVCTPASALGLPLVARLCEAGMEWDTAQENER